MCILAHSIRVLNTVNPACDVKCSLAVPVFMFRGDKLHVGHLQAVCMLYMYVHLNSHLQLLHVSMLIQNLFVLGL